MVKASKKKCVTAFVLSLMFFVALICVSVNNVLTVKALDGSPNQDVSGRVSNVNINIKEKDTDIDCVTNNISVAPLYSGRNYTMELSWEIAEDKYDNHIEAGDYIEFDVSDGYFSFSNSVEDNDLVYGGKTVGSWKIEDNKIRVVFSDDCEDFIQVSGYFEISGALYTVARDEQTVTLAGVDIGMTMNPTLSGFPYSGLPTVAWNGGILSKLGVYNNGSNTMNWAIYVNYYNGVKKVTGDNTYRDVENVVIKDVLTDDLVLDRVIISTPINHPKNETTLSTQASFKLNLTSEFAVKNESDFDDAVQWENYINANELTYGVSNDNKTIIINLGDLPGTMTMADNRSEFISKLTAGDVNLTTDEKNALADIYYDSETGTYPVISVFVDLKVKSNSSTGVFEKEVYSNTVLLTATGGQTSASDQLQVESANAGIMGSTPGTATLIKKDYTTGEVISGASFKLQKYDNDSWVDYVPSSGEAIQVTGADGKVTYSNLGTGRYRFVETEAASTYDINSVEYSMSEFTVSSDDTEGYEVIATNKKLSEPPTTEASTTETSSTESVTTGEKEADMLTGEESDSEPPVNAGDSGRMKMWMIIIVATILAGGVTLVLGKKNNITEE